MNSLVRYTRFFYNLVQTSTYCFIPLWQYHTFDTSFPWSSSEQKISLNYFAYADSFFLENLSCLGCLTRSAYPRRCSWEKHFPVMFSRIFWQVSQLSPSCPLSLFVYHFTCEITACIGIIILDCESLEALRPCFVHICVCNAWEMSVH